MYMGENTPHHREVHLQVEKFFKIDLLGKNVTKYAKLLVEPHVWDNLKPNLPFLFFFSFLTKQNNNNNNNKKIKMSYKMLCMTKN